MKLNRIQAVLTEKGYRRHGLLNRLIKVLVWLMPMLVIGFSRTLRLFNK